MADRVGYALILLVAVEAAVWECFLVPLHPHGTAAVLAVIGNAGLGMAANRIRPGGAVGPGLCWLLVALGLSMGGPLADVIVPGDGSGVVFLVAGVASAAAVLSPWGSKRTSGPTPSGSTGR